MPTKIDIKMWQQRIQRAEDLQAEKHQERKQIIKLYTGTFFGNPISQVSELSEVNFVYEYLKILIGSIYARNPHIFVRARSNRYVPFAETMEIAINYYWRELQLKKKIKQAILDAVLQPPGFIEIGYTLLLEKEKDTEIYRKLFPELFGKAPEGKTEEEQGILDETIKDDNVFANFVTSWNILWPDKHHEIRESPYLIKKQIIPLVDLLANPMFKKSKYDLYKSRMSSDNTQKVKPYRMRDNPQTQGVSYEQDQELIDVTLYHIQDKRSRKRFTLAKNFNNDTLFEKDWNYLIDGFTFYPLIFNEVPQTDEKANSYPMSDIVPMIPQLKELSYLSSAMNRHRKRSGILLLAKKGGSVTAADATNIQNASDVDLIFLDDISEANLKGFTPPPLPRDFYQLREIILQDLMRISGFNQLLYNVKGIETATESENVRAGALIRQSEKVDIIEDFTVDIARGLSGLIWQFINRERIAEIIGENTADERMWPPLPEDEAEARKIIQRELSFRIDAGSTRPPKDEAVERKQWIDVTGTLKATFPNRIKDDIFLQQLLKKFDFKDIEDMIISYDDEEIAIAQQENKLLMQGIPQLISPNENHLLHLQVHGQVYQTQGLTPTEQLDEHTLTHAKHMEQKSPKVEPQRGDTKIAPQTTTPETARRGVPENVDFLGAVKRMPGVGGNRGGI